MKNLILAAVFTLGTAVAANAQTPEPKTADVKAKSCCASKADKAKCAEMKAQAENTTATAEQTTASTKSNISTATVEKDAAKPACCKGKMDASKPCSSRTVAEAKKAEEDL